MDVGSNSTDGSSASLDPARKYRTPDPLNRNNYLCKFCGKITKGGAYWMKQHLLGGFSSVLKCPQCPEHVREEVKAFMLKKQEAKATTLMSSRDFFYNVGDHDDEEESRAGNRATQVKRAGYPYLKNVQEACDKQLRENTCRKIAKFIYDAEIAFNAASYPSFKEMCEAIGQYGPGLKVPTVHELRVPLLKKEVEDTQKIMEDHKKEWAQKGCSILSDGWRDSVTQKDIVNFLVNSPKGSVFIKSVDVSEIVKDADALCQMLDEMVEFVGEKNVIQVVTDNAYNYIKAGKLLQVKRPQLYWTPCAAHCIDLMLEDIEKLPKVKNVLKKCIFMNGYIYNHVSLVNMMRRFTNQKNLHRPAITRFATSFIILAQFHKQKNNLRKMITSQEWNESKWPKEAGGKKIAAYLLQDACWRNVLYTLKLTGPLVKVLRLVDGESKPPMGYIYEAIDRAKEAIAKSFSMKEEEYIKAFEYIDRR